MSAKVFGAVIPRILEKYNTYFKNSLTETNVVKYTVTENSGYMSQNGVVRENSETQNYVYTDPIPCEAGKTVEVRYNGSAINVRFITAFKNGKCVTSASVDCNLQQISKYQVPEGVDSVVFTYQKRSTAPEAVSVIYDITPTVLDTVNPTDINKLYYGGGSGGTATVSKNNSIVANRDTLKAGEYLKLESNQIMNDKTLSISFKIDSMGDSDVIKLGHGETAYGGSYVELTKTNIKAFNYQTSAGQSLNEAHGLTVSGTVNIIITTHLHNADITVSSGGKTYTKTVSWSGRNGEIFAVSTASDLTDVRMRWYCAA